MANKKCLIVDDVEVSRYVLNVIMQDLGFDVGEAVEKKDLLERLQESQFNVIFLDWHLRKCSGLDLVPDIRKIPSAAHTPIVVCTGVELQKDIKDIEAIGANGFLKKPITPDRLKEELTRLSLI